MTIACGLCHKTISAERAGRHSQTCKVAVSARVAEDRKARPAQYQPIPQTGAAVVGDALGDLLSAPTQGMLFGEEWTR